MAFLTGDFPRLIPRAVWLSARARNAIRRPVFIGAVGIGAFGAALLAMVLAPQQVRSVRHVSRSELGSRPDTTPFVAGLARARERVVDADASLAQARARVAATPPVRVDTLTTVVLKQRDSLSTAINDLDGLLTRVETAPVPASYRALAESPQVLQSPKIKPLIDSLNEVERDREAFGTTAAADPVFLALTARSSELGRAIQNVAQQRRDDLRQQITKINAPTQRQSLASSAPAVDTAGWVAERDSAQALATEAGAGLTDARNKARQYDESEARLREDARLSAPPVALLGAALIIGIAIGFGSAFVGELRHPRISADEHEVERVTGARVLASITPSRRRPDRARRSADRSAPRYFDPGADGYQLTYLHVARTGASRLMLTVVSADTGVAAVVAMNVAAIAADEARSTLVIDTDARTAPVAAAMRSRAEPGLADIVQRQLDWPEVATQAPVGRDRIVDLIPSGLAPSGIDAKQVVELLGREGQRLLRHYEAIIVVSTVDQAIAGLPGALPITDTVICARVGHTRIADVNRSIDRIRSAGGNPLGLVLWNAKSPSLPSPERIARSPRPLRTAEMQALTTSGR